MVYTREQIKLLMQLYARDVIGEKLPVFKDPYNWLKPVLINDENSGNQRMVTFKIYDPEVDIYLDIKSDYLSMNSYLPPFEVVKNSATQHQLSNNSIANNRAAKQRWVLVYIIDNAALVIDVNNPMLIGKGENNVTVTFMDPLARPMPEVFKQKLDTAFHVYALVVNPAPFIQVSESEAELALDVAIYNGCQLGLLGKLPETGKEVTDLSHDHQKKIHDFQESGGSYANLLSYKNISQSLNVPNLSAPEVTTFEIKSGPRYQSSQQLNQVKTAKIDPTVEKLAKKNGASNNDESNERSLRRSVCRRLFAEESDESEGLKRSYTVTNLVDIAGGHPLSLDYEQSLANEEQMKKEEEDLQEAIRLSMQ